MIQSTFAGNVEAMFIRDPINETLLFTACVPLTPGLDGEGLDASRAPGDAHLGQLEAQRALGGRLTYGRPGAARVFPHEQGVLEPSNRAIGSSGCRG